MRRSVIAASAMAALLLSEPVPALAEPGLPTPLSAADGRRSVRLNVVTDNPAAELQVRQEPRGWTTVCRGNCSEGVDGLGKFVIRGPGVTPSSVFTLPANGPLQTLKVRTGSNFKSELGAIILAIGIPLVTVGTLITIAGADVSKSSDPYNINAAPSLLGAGITVLLVGAGGITAGGVLRWLHRTSVTIDAGPATVP